jgi:hypothetical protein
VIGKKLRGRADETNRITKEAYAAAEKSNQQEIANMKIIRLENGHLEITTPGPLLKYDYAGGGQIAQQFDEGRMFLLKACDPSTGEVETEIRLNSFQDIPDEDRERELEYLREPVQTLSRNSHKVTQTYLGRFCVVDMSEVGRVGQDFLTESRTELAPMVAPPLDWSTHWDGQELMELAIKAEVNSQKLLGVSAACARLVVHMTSRAPQPLRAVEAIDAWARGVGSVEEMRKADLENDPLSDEMLCAMLHSDDDSEGYAYAASDCDPRYVVSRVVEAMRAALKDRCTEVETASLTAFQKQSSILMRTACANIVRGIIKLNDHPALTEQIQRRNEALCRVPRVELSQWMR